MAPLWVRYETGPRSVARLTGAANWDRIVTIMAQRFAPSSPAPPGWPTVIPRIVANDAEGLVGFIKLVFGATGEYQVDRPTELKIGDSVVLISDSGLRNPMAAFLYVYVDDADATYRAALHAGARSIEDPVDTPYGDRRGMIEDRWGNTWQIATPL